MEVARNPTDENIKNWFSVIEAKNKIMMRLQENLTRYLAENQLKLKNEEKQVIQNEINKMPKLAEDPYRYRFRLYFDSHCPHCKNMMQTMQDFQSMGYFVEIKQVDNKRPKFAVPFPITQATTEELKSRKIQASPTLFIADSKTKQIYRVEGYQTSTKILKNLSTK